ncbi:MAG: O-antigen ligase family protein [Cyclobacteriaceae bacterium]
MIQIYFFVRGQHYGYTAEPFSFIELYPRTIGPFLPRLTGGFIDPNVCGYYFTFFCFLSFINEKLRSYRLLFMLIVVFTLSRSAIAALFAAYFLLIGLNIIDDFHLLTRVRKKTLKLLAALVLCVSVLVYSVSGKLFSFIGTALNARLSDKGSTNIHVNLYDLAFNELSNNMMALIFGKGFSTSFIYTRDIFGDNKYGNFHSEYVTFLFETGIIGSIIYALFFLVPLFQLIRNRKEIKYANVLIAILFSIFLQNIFYQQYMFFYYWIIIAYLWYQTFSSRLKVSI